MINCQKQLQRPIVYKLLYEIKLVDSLEELNIGETSLASSLKLVWNSAGAAIKNLLELWSLCTLCKMKRMTLSFY